MKTFPLIENGAADDRHLASKAVSWAIRSIGGRSAGLNSALLQLGERLASAEDAPSRTVGQLAIKDLRAPALQKRLASARANAKKGRR